MTSSASFEAQLQQAISFFRAGRFEEAAATYAAMPAAGRQRGDALNLGAMIEMQRGRHDDAKALALQAVAALPGDSGARFTLAQIYTALEQYDHALTELRGILRRDPLFHLAHRQIWYIMKTRGQQGAMTQLIKQRLAALDVPRIAARNKVNIPDTTLCCIDCKNHALAIRAMELSMAGCEFSRAVFLTDQTFEAGPIETVVIDPIRSLQDYSNFVMRDLVQHIETEYVLLVQWDGYVVNPAAWSDQFLLFDYIGARWPEAFGIPAKNSVGNGGFSLRSRDLLEALQDPAIPFPPAGEYRLETHSEDFAICLQHRAYLEQKHGIAFAPADVADRFSFEHIDPAGPTFGFHGQVNITRFVDDMALRLFDAAAQ